MLLLSIARGREVFLLSSQTQIPTILLHSSCRVEHPVYEHKTCKSGAQFLSESQSCQPWYQLSSLSVRVQALCCSLPPCIITGILSHLYWTWTLNYTCLLGDLKLLQPWYFRSCSVASSLSSALTVVSVGSFLKAQSCNTCLLLVVFLYFSPLLHAEPLSVVTVCLWK